MTEDDKYIRVKELEDYIKNYLSEIGHENYNRFCPVCFVFKWVLRNILCKNRRTRAKRHRPEN